VSFRIQTHIDPDRLRGAILADQKDADIALEGGIRPEHRGDLVSAAGRTKKSRADPYV
jgi:hypothetical protein